MCGWPSFGVPALREIKKAAGDADSLFETRFSARFATSRLAVMNVH
jgi:hypothetical protein